MHKQKKIRWIATSLEVLGEQYFHNDKHIIETIIRVFLWGQQTVNSQE